MSRFDRSEGSRGLEGRTRGWSVSERERKYGWMSGWDRIAGSENEP